MEPVTIDVWNYEVAVDTHAQINEQRRQNYGRTGTAGTAIIARFMGTRWDYK